MLNKRNALIKSILDKCSKGQVGNNRRWRHRFKHTDLMLENRLFPIATSNH